MIMWGYSFQRLCYDLCSKVSLHVLNNLVLIFHLLSTFMCIKSGPNDVLTLQFSSVAQSCPTLCNPMNCGTPGLPVHHQLPEFTQTHVHPVGDALQPSHSLSSPSPPAPQSLPASESFRMSQLFATPWIAARQASLSITEFTQTHVHRVSDAIQPSHPLSSPSPPAPNPAQHQSLFQWVNSSHEVAKVLEFQL